MQTFAVFAGIVLGYLFVSRQVLIGLRQRYFRTVLNPFAASHGRLGRPGLGFDHCTAAIAYANSVREDDLPTPTV